MDILTYFSNFVDAVKYKSDLTYFKNVKLKDVLVPLAVTVNRAIQIESNNKLPLSIYGGEDVYTVPYPWGTPLRTDFYEADLKDLTIPEITEWRESLNSRMYPLIHNSITKDRLDELDSEDDTGIIVHSLDGELELFQYSDIDEIRCTIIPESMPTIFKQYLNRELTPTDAVNLLTGKDEYRLAYDYMRNGVPVDNDYTILTPFAITYDQCCGWSTYINTMVQLKSKILYLL